MEYRNLAEIKINPKNPRLIKDEKFARLVKSIKEFPEMLEKRPIVCNADLIVLGGNMRLKACKEAGLKKIPVEIVDWTTEKQKEFIIKDNVGFGEWDYTDLQTNWDVEQLDEWGLELPDFGQQVEEHINEREKPEAMKCHFMLSAAIEHKDTILKKLNELAKDFNAEVLVSESSTF